MILRPLCVVTLLCLASFMHGAAGAGGNIQKGRPDPLRIPRAKSDAERGWILENNGNYQEVILSESLQKLKALGTPSYKISDTVLVTLQQPAVDSLKQRVVSLHSIVTLIQQLVIPVQDGKPEGKGS